MRATATVLASGVVRAAAILTLLSGAAAAADHPAPINKAPPPAAVVPSWTGIYIGAGVGVRSSQTDATVTRSTSGPTNLMGFCATFAPGCVTGEPLNDTAFRISPYIGFNWQFAPQWVAGIEADYGFASKTTTLNGMVYPANNALAGITGLAGDSFSVKTTWDASARARLGFLPNPALLVYATGGAAWIHVESTSTCSIVINGTCGLGLTTPPNITNERTKAGWTAGGGIEAMLGGNWMVRGEYRYADFGTISNTDVRTITFVPVDMTHSYDLRIRTHTATLGLAYKFGGSGGAVPAAMAAYAAVPQAAPSWRGFYAGLGGGTRSTTTDASTRSFSISGVGSLAASCANTFGCASEQVLNGTAFRLSPYAGYNWQLAPNWIAGIEGDFGFADQTTRLGGMPYPALATLVSVSDSESFSVRTTWDASLRGRAGFLATPLLLLYATGGAAWMRIESTSACSTSGGSTCSPANAGNGPLVLSHATTKLGWTAGGGLEHQLWSNWLVRAEYRYADFGTITNSDVRTGNRTAAATYDLHVKSHTTNFGVAYKF